MSSRSVPVLLVFLPWQWPWAALCFLSSWWSCRWNWWTKWLRYQPPLLWGSPWGATPSPTRCSSQSWTQSRPRPAPWTGGSSGSVWSWSCRERRSGRRGWTPKLLMEVLFTEHTVYKWCFIKTFTCSWNFCVNNPLTGHLRSRDTASAARKPRAASRCPCEAWWCRVQSCPAGRQSLPRCTAGPPWDPLVGRGPSTWGRPDRVGTQKSTDITVKNKTPGPTPGWCQTKLMYAAFT